MFNWLKKAFNKSPDQKRTITYDQLMQAGFLLPPTQAGVFISEETSLTIAPVWAAVRVISSAFAQFPQIVYERLDGGKNRADTHPVAEFLDNPSDELTPFDLRELMLSWALLWGNAYAEIVFDGVTLDPLALVPIHPCRVTVDRDGQGQIRYTVKNDDGGQIRFDKSQIFHVKGLSPDGSVGYRLVQIARESLGLTKALETFGASFFGNGSQLGGYLKYPGKLADPARENLKKSLEERHQGPHNSFKIGVLEEGLEYVKTGVDPEQGQFNASRQQQLLEVARLFTIQPHKLAALDRATWGNIESENLSFIQDTLSPWVCKWEQESNRKFFRPEDRKKYFTEHLLDSRLRGSTLDRFNAYKIATGNKAWMLPSEVRERENLNPLPDIDSQPAAVDNSTKDQNADTGNQNDGGPDSGGNQSEPN